MTCNYAITDDGDSIDPTFVTGMVESRALMPEAVWGLTEKARRDQAAFGVEMDDPEVGLTVLDVVFEDRE